ncbi:heme exporter protein CcmD [Litorimonas sp. RW-G-Af-16]
MIDLGKDAAFIWTCYGISALILGVMIIQTRRKPRK